jgi:hypothetical protein
VVYIDREGRQHTEGARLAGPTLIWTNDVATYRLEGIPDLSDALAVAESMA